MNFLNNKYTIWYENIVANAKSRATTVYVEKHHIIPKSLGGTDDTNNLVSLTAREHFISHWLLVKMTTGTEKTKMMYALFCMRRNSNSKKQERYSSNITSRVYQYYKTEFIQRHSQTLTGKTWSGTSDHKANRLKNAQLSMHSPEARAKRSQSMQGKNTGPMTEAGKAKMSAAKKGHTWEEIYGIEGAMKKREMRKIKAHARNAINTR
jgi:hypothetical protein